jgi:prepilin-type N-terminal cleavage/methylation domain-containing protein
MVNAVTMDAVFKEQTVNVSINVNLLFDAFTPFSIKERDMKTTSVKKSGFTLVEIMIVVAIIGLLAAIAIPNFVKARTTSQQNACINNLRLIDASKQQWALEQKKQGTDTPQGTDLQPYLGRGSNGELPACPVDPQNAFSSSYSQNNIGTPPTCNIVSSSHVLP